MRSKGVALLVRSGQGPAGAGLEEWAGRLETKRAREGCNSCIYREYVSTCRKEGDAFKKVGHKEDARKTWVPS